MNWVTETSASEALRTARIFLSRWADQLTTEVREDLAQDAAVIAWRQQPRMRDPACFSAMVRTVSRRLRCRIIASRKRHPVVSLDAERSLARRLIQDSGHRASGHSASGHGDSGHRELEVAGVMVPRSWLLEQLEGVLAFQTPLNIAILMAYYQGFSCSELAERYEMPEECVKVRIHRSRLRVRREFEARVERSARQHVTE